MNALLCEKAKVLNQQNQLANDFSPKKNGIRTPSQLFREIKRVDYLIPYIKIKLQKFKHCNIKRKSNKALEYNEIIILIILNLGRLSQSYHRDQNLKAKDKFDIKPLKIYYTQHKEKLPYQ